MPIFVHVLSVGLVLELYFLDDVGWWKHLLAALSLGAFVTLFTDYVFVINEIVVTSIWAGLFIQIGIILLLVVRRTFVNALKNI